MPNEKVLLLGDLIVNPITFALSGYPTEWLQALERIDRLDATTIVTGHGAPLHDKTLLRATMNVFRVLLREGKSAKARGLDPDQAQAAILPRSPRPDDRDHARRSGVEQRVPRSARRCTTS